MKLLILFFLIGCASTTPVSEKKVSGLSEFKYEDASGVYNYSRETKVQGSKVITRAIISDKNGNPLETAVTVSKLGKIASSNKSAMLPEASQFQVWFSKKKYQSQIKVVAAKKQIVGKVKYPDKDEESFSSDLKNARYYCFFSQLAECIEMQDILVEARTKSLYIYIIWDNYPFNSEQYDKMPKGVATLAKFSYSQKQKDSLGFELDIGNQIIHLHFDRQIKFEKMFWIAQGISITKKGN